MSDNKNSPIVDAGGVSVDAVVRIAPEEHADLFEKELMSLINKYDKRTLKIDLLKKLNWAMGNVIIS